jgi:hypothetical protein
MVGAAVSEGPAAFIFSVEEGGTTMGVALYNPDGFRNRFVRNVDIHLQECMVSQARKPHS